MKIKYQAQNNCRIKKGTYKSDRNCKRRYSCFIGISAYDPTTGTTYWWVDNYGRWYADGERPKDYDCASNYHDGCCSVKAFKRRIKKWSIYMPKTVEYIFKSAFIGYDVYGKA